MHVPKLFRMLELNRQHDFIDTYGFGVITSVVPAIADKKSANSLQATHLPFLLDKHQGDKGVLLTHIAKANSHWKSLEEQNVLIVFSGPHGYVSPTWYASVPSVPTWNYTAVHVHGKVNLLDSSQTLDVINQTIEKYEPNLNQDKVIIPDAHKEKLSSAIVGLKITISSIEGKQKLSQNKSKGEQINVISALEKSSHLGDKELGQYMNRVLLL